MISSWEQWNAGGGGTTELEVPAEKEGGGRRKSQEFRDLCKQFGGIIEDGVKEDDVRQKPRVIPKYSFADVASTLPGPNGGRGARRKLFRQTQISFDVMKGGSRLVNPSTNRKRGLDPERDSEKPIIVKKQKVLGNQTAYQDRL